MRPSGRDLLVIDRHLAERELQVIQRPGISVPLIGATAGTALLPLQSSEARRAIVADARITPMAARASLGMLPTVLKGIRDTGWASGEGELMEGTSTIATAFDTVLRPLAVSIPVPTARFSPNRSLFRDCLLQCRDKILSDIGLQALQQR